LAGKIIEKILWTKFETKQLLGWGKIKNFLWEMAQFFGGEVPFYGGGKKTWHFPGKLSLGEKPGCQ
jgi:hypothetical protein